MKKFSDLFFEEYDENNENEPEENDQISRAFYYVLAIIVFTLAAYELANFAIKTYETSYYIRTRYLLVLFFVYYIFNVDISGKKNRRWTNLMLYSLVPVFLVMIKYAATELAGINCYIARIAMHLILFLMAFFNCRGYISTKKDEKLADLFDFRWHGIVQIVLLVLFAGFMTWYGIDKQEQLIDNIDNWYELRDLSTVETDWSAAYPHFASALTDNNKWKELTDEERELLIGIIVNEAEYNLVLRKNITVKTYSSKDSSFGEYSITFSDEFLENSSPEELIKLIAHYCAHCKQVELGHIEMEYSYELQTVRFYDGQRGGEEPFNCTLTQKYFSNNIHSEYEEEAEAFAENFLLKIKNDENYRKFYLEGMDETDSCH